jgi:putative transposase
LWHRDSDLWAYHRGVTLDFSRPEKPTDNAFIASFNGKFRAECLNAHWFMSLDGARRKCEAWRSATKPDRAHPSVSGTRPALTNRAGKKSAGRSKVGVQFKTE